MNLSRDSTATLLQVSRTTLDLSCRVAAVSSTLVIRKASCSSGGRPVRLICIRRAGRNGPPVRGAGAAYFRPERVRRGEFGSTSLRGWRLLASYRLLGCQKKSREGGRLTRQLLQVV